MGHVWTEPSVIKPHHRAVWPVLGALAAGVVLAACSSGSSSSTTTAPATPSQSSGSTATTVASGGSNGALKSVVDKITKTTGATFSVTYLTAHGATGQSQSVTFAQSPPKSAVITPSGSFYIDGSTVTSCQGSGTSITCASLPSGLSSSVNGFTDLFSPGILTNTLRGLEAEVAAHADGVSLTTSSATYGGLASTCFTVKSPSEPTPVTYCASNSSGVLTYENAEGATVTLTAYTANPPASTFAPPAGATVETIPAGT
jgi:hypothetical protein